VADAAEVAHGVHGIVELRAAEILTGLGKRGNEVRMLGACKGDHGKPVRKRSEVLLQLVRGTARGMKWSSSKLKRRSAARATERWPLWMGSKEPPKIAMRRG